jgi:hypothetical protein
MRAAGRVREHCIVSVGINGIRKDWPTGSPTHAHRHRDPRCDLFDDADVHRNFRPAFGARGGRCYGWWKDLRPLRSLAIRPDRVKTKSDRRWPASFGRKSGTEHGYSYSSAVKGLNVTWDEPNLNEWLQGPSKVVNGTKMIYSAPNEKDWQDAIARRCRNNRVGAEQEN